MEIKYSKDVFFTIVEQTIEESIENVVYYNNEKENLKYKIASFVKFINAVDYVNYLIFTVKDKKSLEITDNIFPVDSSSKENLDYEETDKLIADRISPPGPFDNIKL